MKKIIYPGLFIFLIFSSGFTQDVLKISIEDAQKLAGQKNPILQMQIKSVAAQKGKYWADLMPEKPEIGVEIEQVAEGQAYSNYQEKKLFFSQEFEFPTNYYFRHKLLNAEIQHELYGVDAVKRTLIFRVKKAYFKVLLQKRSVELAKQNIELKQSFYTKTKRSFELGETERLTMLKSKVNLGVARKQLKSLQKDKQAAESHLIEILGLKHQEVGAVVLTDTIPETTVLFSAENSLQYLDNHPALKAAEIATVAAANARILAYGSILPNLSFSYFKQEIADNNFRGGEISLTFPLWFPGQKGKIAEKAAQLAKSKYFLISEQLRIRKEFDQAVSRFENAQADVELYKSELLAESEEIFRIAQKSFDVGEISYLEFIDAQQTLIQTGEGYLLSLFNYQVEKANLVFLTGVEF